MKKVIGIILIVVITYLYLHNTEQGEKILSHFQQTKEQQENNKADLELSNPNLKNIDEINTALRGEVPRKMKQLLGFPDVEGIFSSAYYNVVTYAVYFDKVKSDNKVKHLVLLCAKGEISSVGAYADGEKCYDMTNEYIVVKRNGVEGSNQYFNKTSSFGF